MISPSLSVSALTDVGLKRSNNEDSLIAISYSDLDSLGVLGVFAVADGMGGHAHGDQASQMAIGILYSLFDPFENYHKYCLRNNLSPEKIDENLVFFINIIDRQIKMFVQEKNVEDLGVGTTLTIAVIKRDYLYWAHVGDSRLYLLRNSKLELLSEDHTLIADQLRRGLISQEEAQMSHQKNVLLQAVGCNEQLEIQTGSKPLQDKDVLLLCSDGLHGLVSDEDIGLTLLKSPPEATHSLISLANKAGGKDNISAIVANFKQLNSDESEIILKNDITSDLNQNKNKIKKNIYIYVFCLILCAFIYYLVLLLL